MRSILIGLVAVVAVVAGWVVAGGAVAGTVAGAVAEADGSIDQVLGQLDQVGKNLREFSAKLRLRDEDSMGGDVAHAGNVVFQRKADGGVRIHVVFDQRISSGKRSAEKTEYLLDGRSLIDRNYRAKNEVKREVLKPGEKMDLFKLGEGPFPLPIGQSPADVHGAFAVAKVAPAKDDPAGSVHLQLMPKLGTELGRKFRSIDVFVDQKTHMPVRVITESVKDQRTSTTDLTDVVLNPPGGLKEGDFALPGIEGLGWTRSVETLRD